MYFKSLNLENTLNVILVLTGFSQWNQQDALEFYGSLCNGIKSESSAIKTESPCDMFLTKCSRYK